jgi:uncharacterized protein (TIGR02145 family)
MQHQVDTIYRKVKTELRKPEVQKRVSKGLIITIMVSLVFSAIFNFYPEKTKASAPYQFKTGKYVGSNGGRDITGLGFKPELVILKATTTAGVGAFFTSTALADNASGNLASATANDNTGLIVLEADGFSVAGTNSNSANVNFTWMAWAGSDCSATGQFCVGTYTGDGSGTKSINTGFQPDSVFVKSNSTVASTFRTSNMPINHAQFLMAANEDTTGDYFTTLDSTGFTVGASNNTAVAWSYFAFKNTANAISTGTFTGTGVAQNITGLGYSPDAVIIKNADATTAVGAVYNVTQSYGNSSSYFTDTANVVGAITTTAGADGFSVGAHATANGSGNTIYWLSFGGAEPTTSSGTFKMASGTYVGNNTATTGPNYQNIVGLGFSPDLVIIKGDTTAAGAFRTSLMSGDSTALLDGATANFALGIQQLTQDGFNVGTSATVNANGVTYYWTAYGNAWKPGLNTGASDFMIGSYYGNGLSGRDITNMPWQPDLVVIKNNTTQAGVFKTSAHAGLASSLYSATADANTHILALNSDGFKIGNTANVNSAAGLYWYFAFKNGANFKVGSYTGTTADQDVTDVGFQPDNLWVKAATNVRGVQKTSDMPAANSIPFINVAEVTTNFNGLLSNGFDLVGAAADTNVNGTTFRYVAWKKNTGITITLGQTGTQTATISVPSTDNYIGAAFTLVTDSSSANITSITVSETGTVNATTNLSNLDIRYETAGTCTYEGTETLFGTAASFNSSQKATVTGNVYVSTNQVCIYAVLDVGAGAADNETIELEIGNPTTEVVTNGGNVTPGNAIVLAGTTILQEEVIYENTYNLATGDAYTGTSSSFALAPSVVYAGSFDVDGKGTTFDIDRGVIRLNTSNIGSVSTVLSATLYMYRADNNFGYSNTTIYRNSGSFSFSNFSTPTLGTLVPGAVGTWSNTAVTADYINKTGYTWLTLRGNESNGSYATSWASYGTSYKPYLVVSYSAAPANTNPSAPASLTQKTSPGDVAISESAWTNDNNPTLGFNITDPDSDAVKYRIQVSVDSYFDQPDAVILDYTLSATQPSGTTFAYTVGQSGGTYAVGSESMTLNDSATGYWWRVRAIDEYDATSSYVEHGASGTVDFKVDATNPTISSFRLNDYANYANANNRVVKATGIYNDSGGSSGTLKVQFSEDQVNWGVYSGSGTTNNKSTDWTYFTTVTASGTAQDINGAWYLEGSDGGKYLYVRSMDNAGNVAGWGEDTANFVKIGNQIWSRENLDYGVMLSSGTTMSSNNGMVEKWCYNNSQANCNTYGGLYSWDEVMGYSTTEGTQGICPIGFHVPSDNDWKTLESELGITPLALNHTGWRGTDQGDKLKRADYCYGGINCGLSGFDGILSGILRPDGVYDFLGEYDIFWTSTQSSLSAWRRNLYLSSAQVRRDLITKDYALGTRCLKNDLDITTNANTFAYIVLDATAPTGGTVNDGQLTGGDLDWNADGSLTQYLANWTATAPNSDISGLSKYEYAIRRYGDNYYWTPSLPGYWGAGEYWYDNSTNTSFTVTNLNLETSTLYYVSLKTTDNAGNTATISSNGIRVTPTLSYSLNKTSMPFEELDNGNGWTDTESITITTSTNASGGYTVKAYASDYLRSLTYVSDYIINFIGSWLSPQSWGNYCYLDSGSCGFGYTSNDTSVQGSNRFNNGANYAAYTQATPGDVVADNLGPVNGLTGAISNEQFIVTNKLSVNPSQTASDYRTDIFYIVTANY